MTERSWTGDKFVAKEDVDTQLDDDVDFDPDELDADEEGNPDA